MEYPFDDDATIHISVHYSVEVSMENKTDGIFMYLEILRSIIFEIICSSYIILDLFKIAGVRE